MAFVIAVDNVQYYFNLIRMNAEAGVAGYVARTGQMVNMKDVHRDPDFNKDINLLTGSITRSILCFPIIEKTLILG